MKPTIGLLAWVELSARQPPGGGLYPVLPAGAGGLAAAGTVLLDQLVAVDVRRVKKQIGSLSPAEYQPIAQGLRALFGL